MKEGIRLALSSALLLILTILFFLGTNIYISFRIFPVFRALFPQLHLFRFTVSCLILAVLAVLSVVRSRLNLNASLKYALGLYGGYWMGVYVYLLLTLLAAELLLLILGLFTIIPLPVSGKARCLSGLAAILVTAVIVLAGTVHADHFMHRSYEVVTEKITDGREWNIVLVSDLHIGAVRSEDRLEHLVSEINSLQPDAVCIAGDFFDSDFSAIREPERCAKTLQGICTKYGVFACLGNHDAGSTAGAMLEFLPRCGIRLLDECCTVLDGSLTVIGRLDRSPIGGYAQKGRGVFSDAAFGVDPSLPVVVLDHTPSHIREYPGWVDLILCGHTHHGQIFPGSLFTKHLFPVDYGFYRENEDSPAVIVTSGAGTWGLPMRVGSDSEIVSIRLKGQPLFQPVNGTLLNSEP